MNERILNFFFKNKQALKRKLACDNENLIILAYLHSDDGVPLFCRLNLRSNGISKHRLDGVIY